MKKLLCMILALAMVAGLGAAAFADDTVTITFQTWNPGDDTYTGQIIEGFESTHPGIKIDYVYMPYSDHIADMQIKMNNGEGPDVYGMQVGATYNEFRQYEVGLNDYAAASWGEDWENRFLSSCMEMISVDGQYYGLPLGLTYAGLVWADEAKLESLGLTVPTNYEELKAVATALREAGELPLAIGAKDDWINIDTFMNIGNDVAGDKLYQAIEGEVSFTDADLVKTFEIWQNMFTDGIFQDGCLGVNMYNDTTDLWEDGEAPLALNGSWALGTYLQSDDPDKYATFNAEGANHTAFLMDWDGDGDTAGLQASIDVILCMNSNCQHKDEAWEFIKYMLYEGQNLLINDALYYFPSRTDFELAIKGLNEDGSEVMDNLVELSKTTVAGYREMSYADLKQAICDVLSALGTGEMTPAEAAEYVEAASQAQAR